MTDEFDIVDIVFKATEAAATGLIGCKGNSATGEKNDHYTVNTTGVNTLKSVNKSSSCQCERFHLQVCNRNAEPSEDEGVGTEASGFPL